MFQEDKRFQRTNLILCNITLKKANKHLNWISQNFLYWSGQLVLENSEEEKFKFSDGYLRQKYIGNERFRFRIGSKHFISMFAYIFFFIKKSFLVLFCKYFIFNMSHNKIGVKHIYADYAKYLVHWLYIFYPYIRFLFHNDGTFKITQKFMIALIN